MSSPAPRLRDSATELLAIVERDRRERCERAMADGARAARELVQRARSEAHRRTRAAVRDDLARNRRRVEAAEEELVTQERQQAQRLAASHLEASRERLRAELGRRWENPEARARWLARAVAEAGRVLLPGAWLLETSASCSAEQIAALESQLTRLAGEPPRVVVRAQIEAGARILADGACLDATCSGLLADQSAIESRLLAELERARARRAGGAA